MARQAIIVPGSSSWWLLTLSPVIYFDKVRAPADDMAIVEEEEDKSFYHWSAARVLKALEKHADEEVLVRDSHISGGGRTSDVTSQATKIADALIEAADNYNPWKPTIVKPSELKTVMTHAYREWILYNKKKTLILSKKDPLCQELMEKQLPCWQSVLRMLKSTHARRIPELLKEDDQLNTVYRDIIRNAYLDVTTGGDPGERAYDVLAVEFLPAIKLVERHQVFHELPDKLPEIVRFDTLLHLYDFQMRAVSQTATGHLPEPESVVVTAFRERKRFSTLRKRLTEIDSIIQEETDNEEILLNEVISLARDLHKQIRRIEQSSKALMWIGGAYGLKEFISSLDSAYAPLMGVITTLILNPWTKEAARKSLANLYLSAKGIGGGAGTAMAVVRDYLGVLSASSGRGPRLFGPGVYKFWA